MPRPASTTARGYGARHQAERKRWGALVAAGSAICWRCNRPILPGMAWDLGHHDHDRSRYRGPEHRHCNRSAGARKGNRTRGQGKSSGTPRPLTPQSPSFLPGAPTSHEDPPPPPGW